MKTVERWTEEKLQALTSMELENPETWPKTMRDRKEANQRLVGLDQTQQNLPLIRLSVIEEAISRQLANQRAYLDVLLDARWGLAEPGTIQAKLVRAVDELSCDYWSDTIRLCIELVPRLDALWPPTTVPEILEALGSPRPDGVPEPYEEWLKRCQEEEANESD